MEYPGTQIGDLTVHYEDNKIFISVVKDRLIMVRVKHIYTPVLFSQQHHGIGAYTPKYEKHFSRLQACTQNTLKSQHYKVLPDGIMVINSSHLIIINSSKYFVSVTFIQGVIDILDILFSPKTSIPTALIIHSYVTKYFSIF